MPNIPTKTKKIFIALYIISMIFILYAAYDDIYNNRFTRLVGIGFVVCFATLSLWKILKK